MTLAAYAAELFRYGTGWLGWTPQTTLAASIHHIELALDGKVDFLRKTSPFGGGGGGDSDNDAKPAAASPPPAAEAADPAKASRQLMAFLRKRQAPQR